MCEGLSLLWHFDVYVPYDDPWFWFMPTERERCQQRRRRRTWYRWMCNDKSSYLLNIKMFLLLSLRFVILDILECINIQLTRYPHVLNNVSCYKTLFFSLIFSIMNLIVPQWDSRAQQKRRKKPSELVVIIKVDFMWYPRTFISFAWLECVSSTTIRISSESEF